MSNANASKGLSSLKVIMWYTYILKCADDRYYTGHTNDLSERLSRHNTGRGPKWTVGRLPVQLAYQESHENKETAVKREKQIKKWSRFKKEALIHGDVKRLKSLSKRNHKTSCKDLGF